MITHIIFDNNGVLTTNDDEGTYKAVANYLGTSIKEVISLFDLYVLDLDAGKISQEEFYSLILKAGHFKRPIKEFKQIHLDAYKPKPDVQEFVKKLVKKYDTYLLTNFGDAFWDLFEKWNLDKIFDRSRVFVSSDLKMAKPDSNIYLFVLDNLKAKPHETIFIDDNSENVVSAENLGIHGILYKNLSSLISSLERLGVRI
ncbi:MAG: HAD family phosphatase [Nanoarchaeota archaeon]|nr:HAD family phosphatase [Nanoarchaeota archaeon]